MEDHLSSQFKKWMKKCLNDEFSNTIDDNLNGDRNPYDVAQKIINSREMTELTNAIRSSFIEQIDASRTATSQNSALNSAIDSRPQTSVSCISDLSGDDWSLKGTTDQIGLIVEQMSYDKPDHFRLAGYEALLENEFINIYLNNSWKALLKTLRDGLIDGSRSIFEASLLVHSKLLNCPQFYDAYMNLLNTFTELYHSKKLCDLLPTVLSGINCKIFLHEKLVRIMKLILDHHEEVLKGIRFTDKLIEETIEQFIAFLCSHTIMNISQLKLLNVVNILSVIEPQAGWSKKWMHSFNTRKSLCTAIAKSPSLIHNFILYVKKGLESPPTGITVFVSDEPPDIFISGDSVETLTFLHCLNFLTQLCGTYTGRTLLSEIQTEDVFSIPDFLTALLSSLNILASSEASNSMYETVRAALSSLLQKSIVLYDARFYQIAWDPLVQTETKILPHTLDVLIHMLDTSDGPTFLMTEYVISSVDNKNQNYPVVTILLYASNLLRQPLAVLSMAHLTNLFRFVGNLFNINEIFYIIEEIVRENFYPSVTYMYSKLDKYYIENESKAQHIDKAVKEMLLNLVRIPLGLQMLSNEPLVFEELIRGSISSIRVSWSDFNVVGFISNSGFFSHGAEILSNLAPHVLSTLLIEISKILEDPQQFHDPWENSDVKVFLHVLALFSLNTNCFIVFMSNGEANKLEENEYITNLHELFQQFTKVELSYHYLGLLSLKELIWNLDIYIYLIHLLNFQDKLLEFQEFGLFVNEEHLERKSALIVDEASLLRHTILLECYYMRYKWSQYTAIPEESHLFSKLPPPDAIEDDESAPQRSSTSELTKWLLESGPGIRDSNWVIQTRKAHRASSDPIKNSILLDLLNQMEKAIPTVEWVDRFKWDSDLKCSDDYWFPEEECGIDLVLHYGELNSQLQNTEQARKNLKIFIQSSHHFINYNKSTKFKGFDWFLATIFLICSGNIDKAKIFITQILHFPSAMFMWSALAQVVDENNEEESSTRLLFAQLLENIITHEFSAVKFALKNKCGIDWWIICDKLLTQCFWGILQWNEILHYFAICILHPPDYILYYCASLLNHCQDRIMKNIVKGNQWPEHMALEDYRCHSQMGFMDRLGKRHGGKVLPPLMLRKLNFPEDLNSIV